MYGCKCNCRNFAEHVGNGPFIPSSATPTRGQNASYAATEKQWDKDFEAYKRLDKNHGVQLQSMDGAAAFEKNVTQPVELQTGKIYGPERAKKMQAVVDGD